MTKSLFLAATALTLSLGAGTAMAQEADAQNLYNGSPRVFDQFSHGAFETVTGSPAGSAARSTYVVVNHQISPAPDGGDGSGN